MPHSVVLKNKMFSCLISDIDECRTGEHNCQQSCNNLPGTYNCSCNTGFILNSDSRTCRGRNLVLLIHFDFILLVTVKIVTCTKERIHDHTDSRPQKVKETVKYAVEAKITIINLKTSRNQRRFWYWRVFA